MKKGDLSKASVGFLLCLLIAAAGCFWTAGCIPTEKYERTVHLSAPLSPGGSFEAQTHNGYINITGADVSTCDVTATITAKAATTEKARKLAEETRIKLEPAGDKLRVKVEKPPMADKDAICVSFDITVPEQTALDLKTNVGELNVENTTRPIEAATNVGTITCKEITGRVDLTSNVGEVKVVYAETAPSACNANINTDIGEINFDGPPDLSAQVNVSVNIGSIQTDLPLTVTGKINKSLSGTIGKGEGKITLKTNIGSIKIR